MKKVFNPNSDIQFKIGLDNELANRSTLLSQSMLYLVILLTAFLFSACKKNMVREPGDEEQSVSAKKSNTNSQSFNFYDNLGEATLKQLQSVRVATARYHNIGNAFNDRYEDIGLVIENMGYHFLKAGLISPVFDLQKPPILVYNKRVDGSFELVAVEYAIPIDPQSPNTPPEGFIGDDDKWDFNTLNTGWWTLHAWVWKNNPDGAFNPMNPLVIVR
ncbi:MAG TPA: hypothetical protein VF487_08875 [Chitinophagaceae bacterium]